MLTSEIAHLRKEYRLKTLNEADVAKDPITQFRSWWTEAVNSEIDEVNAMTLATATSQGIPSARIVLLKGFEEKGFIFFTNYESTKGRQLKDNPHAALVFFWKELERQVRIEGTVEKLPATESDAYFHSRPVGSQIGAWASPQSSIITGRSVLDTNVAKYASQFQSAITRPDFWGGYIVKPATIEFWQGRSSRLHDRIKYIRLDNDNWKTERLAP